MNISIYAHGGSANHGCEALVRSSIYVLGKQNNQFTLMSECPEEDYFYHINDIADIRNSRSEFRSGIPNLLYRIKMMLTKNDYYYYKEQYRNFISTMGKTDLAIAIGGDNYCYTGFLQQFGTINNMLRKANIPHALWGCSIDPFRISSELIKDLEGYNIITARESITYEALQKAGLKHVMLVPDSAFCMPMKKVSLPEDFKEGNTVGINLSPLIMQHETQKGIVFSNYERLINHILDNTNMSVALIPHVVWYNNDDRKPLNMLYDKFNHNKRIIMINDHNCLEQKYIISKCRFLVAARTHASIAGYSNSVPTLVVGYSVKAEGIAKDLFGSADNYVISANSLKSDRDLIKAFDWIMRQEEFIHNHFDKIIPEYKERAMNGSSITQYI